MSILVSKHSLALSLFLIAAASNFNPVSAVTAFASKGDLQTAVDAYCSPGDTVDSKYGLIEDWDVSQITDMAYLFKNRDCNPPIGKWDVSKVTNFHDIFEYNPTFNQDIGKWDVSSVTKFGYFFDGAIAFNQDISGWNVTSGIDFGSMFQKTTAFNQDISGWDVSSGTKFGYMFWQATAFNQHISGWNIDSGTNFDTMFNGASSFDQPSLYCNWQSNDNFKNRGNANVCGGALTCGWGETTCPVTPAPTPTLTPAPTPSPTSAPTPAPTISLANKYFIALVENSTVATFNDTDSVNEIVFNLKITNSDLEKFGDGSITVLDYETCSGEAYAESVVLAVPDLANKMVDGIYAEVPVLVDINTTDIENISSGYPGYFNATNETIVLKFCVMSKLGESTIYNSTSDTNVTTAISYSKVKVQVDIDMKKGFQSASVDVTEDSPEEEVAESTVDYELNACECDDAGACINLATSLEAKIQNSMINICVYTSDSNDVIIAEIKDMRIYSETLVYNAITDSQANPITLTKSMDAGKKSIVTTRLVGAFFTDLAEGETSSLNIDGTAVMEFAASSPGEPASRKLVRVRSEVSNNIPNEIDMKQWNSDRTLDENVGGDGLGTFETEVEISKRLGAASASDAYNDGHVSPLASAVQSLVMGGVALLAVV